MQEYIKKILGSRTTTLVISNDEMEDIIKIVKSLEAIQNEAKEQKGGSSSTLLGTLGASLLRNILAGKGINRAEKGIVRASYRNKTNF